MSTPRPPNQLIPNEIELAESLPPTCYDLNRNKESPGAVLRGFLLCFEYFANTTKHNSIESII
jgi:hypothetical protein